jgi:hypothetical protein
LSRAEMADSSNARSAAIIRRHADGHDVRRRRRRIWAGGQIEQLYADGITVGCSASPSLSARTARLRAQRWRYFSCVRGRRRGQRTGRGHLRSPPRCAGGRCRPGGRAR